MAAILCKPISACIEFVCTAPCKLCAGGCKLCSDGLSGLCTNPLSAFVFMTWLTQMPLAIAAAVEIPGLFNGTCKGSQWLVGMLGAAIAHMFTSVYLANRVVNKTDEKLRDKHTAWERISYLLCHDPWVAIYLLIVIFDAAWLIIGSGWSLNGAFDDCETGGNVSIVMGLGWSYLILGPSVLSCNLCCACCDKGDYAGDDADFAAEQEARKSQRQSASRKKSSNTNNYTSGEAYTAADIETPPEPKPPRTYSAEGVPIHDDGNSPVMEAEVVIEEATIPPPIPPPKHDGGFNAQQAKVKAEEAASKAAATAQATANKAVKSAKGWFKKKTKGSEAPERKATLY